MFSNYNKIKGKISNRRMPGKPPNIWTLHSIFLNNPCVVGWSVPSKMVSPCLNPWNLEMGPFLEKESADVIKLKNSRWDNLGLSKWTLKTLLKLSLWKKEKENAQTQRSPCEDGCRDWTYIATPQIPEAIRNCDRQEIISPGAFRGSLALPTP